MLEILKIVHYLSFAVAIGAGVSNLILGARVAGFPPEAMPNIGAFRLTLGKLTTHGLILLWITGIALITVTTSTAIFQNSMFLFKLAVVLVLSGISIMANMTISQARKNNAPPDAVRMKQLGMAGLTMAILALVLAIIAFS